MIGYKIRYGDYDHDCWGKTEFCGWYDYNNVIYTNYNKAENVMGDAKEQFPDRDWDIYEVEIK